MTATRADDLVLLPFDVRAPRHLARRRSRRHVLDLISVDRSGRPALPELDGVRALAVIAIIVRHVWGVAGQPTLAMNIPGLGRHSLTPVMIMLQNGVDLFFVLSGFLLSMSFFKSDWDGKPRPNLRRYFRSRAYRILPAYWVALFLILVVFTPSLIPLSDIVSVRGLLGFLAHATVMQTTFLVSYGSYGVATPFWTLTIEVLFYIALPWLVYAFYGNRWRLGLPALVGTTFVWLYLSRDHFGVLVHFLTAHTAGRPYPSDATRYFLSKQLPAHLSDFAFGITVANLYTRARSAKGMTGLFRRLTSSGAALCYFIAGVLVVLFFMQHNGSISNLHQLPYNSTLDITDHAADLTQYYYLEEVPFGFGFSLIMAGILFGAPWLRWFFARRSLCTIGVLGYAIYLWHMPIIRTINTYPTLTHSMPLARFGWELLGATLLVVPVALGSFFLVERPFIERGRRRSSASPPPANSVP